ncbi:MAG: hypothetical protein FWG36_01155 [Oscillospiraceae bacterium]|nr:hypothetical protein [Oscillospiraceae bacterium]
MTTNLHRLFNSMPRFKWDMIGRVAFDNGIYIIFEDGETYHGTDRIVRVGTHDSDGRLRKRLKNHFINENKDGSIFRKNVGKAILNKNNDPYLNIWNKNSSKKSSMIGVSGYDSAYQKSIEKTVSHYMREHFSFVCFPVSTMAERHRLEEGIIALLNGATDFCAGSAWLGNHSPEREIVQSGMWLKQGLDGVPLTENEYRDIVEYCSAIF